MTMARIQFTYKQERQIIAIMENMPRCMFPPYEEDMTSAGMMTLIRVCRDYCRDRASRSFVDAKLQAESREKAIDKLINKLNMLSVRYYEKI